MRVEWWRRGGRELWGGVDLSGKLMKVVGWEQLYNK